MKYDVDNGTLHDLEAGTRNVPNSHSWLTHLKNDFKRLTFNIFPNRISSQEHGVIVGDFDDVLHANAEDLTGLKIMLQTDSRPSISPHNSTPPNQFCSALHVLSLPPHSSFKISHSSSPEIADPQVSRYTLPTPLEHEGAVDRYAIRPGNLPEHLFLEHLDNLITHDMLQNVQPPWLDDEFEEWYWHEYTLKPGSSESDYRSAGEFSNDSTKLHSRGVSPLNRTKEDEDYYHMEGEA